MSVLTVAVFMPLYPCEMLQNHSHGFEGVMVRNSSFLECGCWLLRVEDSSNLRLRKLYQQMDTHSDEDQQALFALMGSRVKRSKMTRPLATTT